MYVLVTLLGASRRVWTAVGGVRVSGAVWGDFRWRGRGSRLSVGYSFVEEGVRVVRGS